MIVPCGAPARVTFPGGSLVAACSFGDFHDRAIDALWKAGISCGKGHVTLLLRRRPSYVNHKVSHWGSGEAMNSIDWHSTILRWSAVAFSLGAWAGIVLAVRQFLG